MRFARDIARRIPRNYAIAGGIAAAIGAVAVVVLITVFVSGGGSSEEDITAACLAGATPNKSGDCPRSSGSHTPTRTPNGSGSATPTVAPTPTPVTSAGGTTTPPPPAAPIADGYTAATLAANTGTGSVIEFAVIPGTTNQAIVASQTGKIYKVALDGSFAAQLWGDLSSKVTFGGEQGLLSVAFSPGFASDDRVYAYYTPGSPSATKLSRFSGSASGLNTGSEQVLLSVEEFAANHNGGHIAFDNSGYLLLSLGDGGGGGDPEEAAQDLTRLLGKILRLNVSGAGGYTIPSGNPFNDGAGPIREEIFAYGLRNPWRMTVDPATTDVWAGDVGQNSWEEVDRVVAGGNYGWDCYEGNHSYELTGCPASGFQSPIAEYDHSLGQAVTGGAVYRGANMPELVGWYVYGDFYTGHIWAVKQGSAPVHLMKAPFNVASFTLLPSGEISIVSYDGAVYRLSR